MSQVVTRSKVQVSRQKIVVAPSHTIYHHSLDILFHHILLMYILYMYELFIHTQS